MPPRVRSTPRGAGWPRVACRQQGRRAAHRERRRLAPPSARTGPSTDSSVGRSTGRARRARCTANGSVSRAAHARPTPTAIPRERDPRPICGPRITTNASLRARQRLPAPRLGRSVWRCVRGFLQCAGSQKPIVQPRTDTPPTDPALVHPPRPGRAKPHRERWTRQSRNLGRWREKPQSPEHRTPPDTATDLPRSRSPPPPRATSIRADRCAGHQWSLGHSLDIGVGPPRPIHPERERRLVRHRQRRVCARPLPAIERLRSKPSPR